MTSIRLRAFLCFDGQKEIPVARLGWDDRARHAVAEWDPGFSARSLPLSPLRIKSYNALLRPQQRAFGDLPALFGDSLPDGWGRLLIDRELAARGVSRVEITDLERLALVGTDGMGAMVYRPEHPHQPEKEISLDWFDRLVPELDHGIAIDDLERLRHMAGGSQGARPKFVAQLAEQGTQLRSHRKKWRKGWRQVLIKRRAKLDPPGSVEAEAAYAAMARAAGIEIARVDVLRAESGEAFFVTDRFDRDGDQRLHMQTAAALLETDFRSAMGFDYRQLLQMVSVLTRDRRAVEEMYRRMIFNILAMNRDDHLKNHAFLMNGDGEWRLSPAYDLSFSAGPGGEHSMLIAGEGRYPGRSAMASVAEAAGLRPGRARELIAEVRDACALWPRFARAADVPAVLQDMIGTSLVAARIWD